MAINANDQPVPPDPSWPRYSVKPFPPYRFVPGRSPHPKRHPDGHAYGHEEAEVEPFDPGAWKESEEYRFGVDLYNHAYWWECHECFEGIWHAVGHDTEQGQFLQGIIQVAAANLKRFMGSEKGAAWLSERGLERLARIPSPYMGVDVRAFEREARDYFEGRRALPALIQLSVNQ